jgi:hypothetical protein
MMPDAEAPVWARPKRVAMSGGKSERSAVAGFAALKKASVRWRNCCELLQPRKRSCHPTLPVDMNRSVNDRLQRRSDK